MGAGAAAQEEDEMAMEQHACKALHQDQTVVYAIECLTHADWLWPPDRVAVSNFLPTLPFAVPFL
ncbi:hypothetical protein ABBQ38_005264 [Trebouxia sp. C0009 RCD-2024]